MAEREYDENEALRYIHSQVDEAIGHTYDDDDFVLVVDCMFDYFEANADDDDFELDEPALVAWVQKALKKDETNKVKLEHVAAIVAAELDYEESLDD